MGASITLAGESLIAQRQVAGTGLKVNRFIFANVPGLNPNNPVDRAAPKPAAAQIVYVHEIPAAHAGYVNPNQVVYSAQIGSDVGDWDFNWIGLETVDGVLFAVAYVPTQQKRRNIPPQQVGNNLTRNMLLVFDGAQGLTGITIDAKTWQHDFTARMAGIDERERLSNRDVFGRACFFGSALQVEKVGSSYQVKPGTAYVEGIRLERATALPIVPPALPTTAWLDIALQRQLSDVVASWQVVFGAARPDYTDSAGVKHYCIPLADLPNANTLTDRRPSEPIAGSLVQHFAARTGDYANLRARATTKDDVGLNNVPNAITDDPASDSSSVLASTKMVAAVKRQLNDDKANKLDVFTKTESNKRYVQFGQWNGTTLFSKGTLPTLSSAGTFDQADAPLGVINSGATESPAVIAFHRGGSYGTFFGLDTDNQFAFGGWSTGNKRYRFWTEANFNPDTKANNVQATETVQGTAKVATATQVNTGTDDTTFVTPKKLRVGLSFSLGITGFIAFPTWLGGLVLQWGYGTETHSDTGFRFFPMAFPTTAVAMVAMANFAHSASTWVIVPDRSKYLMGLGGDYVNGSPTASLFWIAIGY